MGKGVDLGNLGRSNCGRVEERMDKKGQWHVNNSLIGLLVCPCPAPGQHSLSCFLVKFHF